MDSHPKPDVSLTAEQTRVKVDAIYCAESRTVLATLIRLLGDFDLAEEALHEAFKAALEQWPHDGVPANPRAWLVSTGRFKAIDALHKRSRLEPLPDDLADRLSGDADLTELLDNNSVEDDRLRSIVTCCHPALAPEAPSRPRLSHATGHAGAAPNSALHAVQQQPSRNISGKLDAADMLSTLGKISWPILRRYGYIPRTAQKRGAAMAATYRR